MKTLPRYAAAMAMAALMSPLAQAAGLVGHFVADAGGSRIVTGMQGCGRSRQLLYTNNIDFYDDGTFQQSLDTNGDSVADVTVTGLWDEPRPNRFMMMYTGSMADGVADTASWGTVFSLFEARLRVLCKDNGVNVVYPTIRVKRQELRVDTEGRAVVTAKLRGFARGGYTSTGAVMQKITAKGVFSRP